MDLLQREQDLEKEETTEPVTPRPQLVLGVNDFRNGGLEMIMMELVVKMMIDDAQKLFFLYTVQFPFLTELKHDYTGVNDQ